MASKVNVKAKIKRHQRILHKKSTTFSSHTYTTLSFISYGIISFFVLFFFPLYPSFSSFLYETSEYDYVRSDIDEASILESYESIEEDDVFRNGFFSVNTILEKNAWNDQRGATQKMEKKYNAKEVYSYQVKQGDTIVSIANKFWISQSVLQMMNDLQKDEELFPWMVVYIPKEPGILYRVKRGDTLSTIALRYKIDMHRIKEYNDIENDHVLIVGDLLYLPWVKVDLGNVIAEKKQKKQSMEKPKVLNNKEKQKKVAYEQKNKHKKQEPVPSQVPLKDEYSVYKRKPLWKFYKGNCTRYVAQYKHVDWSWNAKDWLRNARKKWHPTGTIPVVWSIVVFYGKGYHPIYGHVGIVIDVEDDNIIVSDMNYRKLYEITTRRVSKNDPAIRGYIYTD